MKKKKTNSSFPLKAKFNYWFDNHMSNGSLSLIRVLIVASILLAALIGVLVVLLKVNKEGNGLAASIWDSIATIINAEMPDSEEKRIGYIVLMSITAMAGVLFTSVFIGIITSAIEERIDNLKRGNSIVLEKDHIVVLGFYPGEYELLRQLILAAGDHPTCVVVAENMERQEMEENISENLDIPKSFRIVCRTADITDPASLEKCSVETCRTVIVSPTEDIRTIKTILAVSALLETKGVPEISVNAIVSKKGYHFPPSIAEANNISTIPTNRIMARMMAHSCTQTGISETFREIFNFEGSEFYLITLPDLNDKTFEDIMLRLNRAVPVGLFRDGKITLNPPAEFKLHKTDRILVFSEEGDSAVLENTRPRTGTFARAHTAYKEDKTDTVIIGHNENLPLILKELPENVFHVYLMEQDIPEEEKENLSQTAVERNLVLNYLTENSRSETGLMEIAKMAEHIVILNDHDKDPEEADMEAIFLLLNLRDIRKRCELSFNLTVEMQLERNQKLVGIGDHTDFLVVSSMSSLILAQLAESPELIAVFKEILSNKGNELYLKNVADLKLEGTHTVRDLRQIMLNERYILLGYLDAEKHSYFNPPLDETLTLSAEDNLIVLGFN